MPWRSQSLAVLSLLVGACGQIGFDQLDGGEAADSFIQDVSLETGGRDGAVDAARADAPALDAPGDAPGRDAPALDAPADTPPPIDAGANDSGWSCGTPVVLAQYDVNYGGGLAPGSYNLAALTLGLTSTVVGSSPAVPSGYSGVDDFSREDPGFNPLVARLVDATLDTVFSILTLEPGGSGGGPGVGDDARLVGTRIEFFRRRVDSLTLAPARMRTSTSYSGMIHWEVWGCP